MTQPTEDERVLAAMAHAAVIANAVNLTGMVGAALIWATHRERSPYVRGQALQALLYQGVVALGMLLLLLGWGLCVGLSLLPAVLRPDLHRDSPPPLFWPALFCVVVPMGLGLVATLYGLYAAVQALRGRLFRYPLIGRVASPQPPAEPAPHPDAPPPLAPDEPPDKE